MKLKAISILLLIATTGFASDPADYTPAHTDQQRFKAYQQRLQDRRDRAMELRRRRLQRSRQSYSHARLGETPAMYYQRLMQTWSPACTLSRRSQLSTDWYSIE